MEQEDENKADEILASLDLDKLADRHPMSLSGGQKQRVAIAAAVASDRDTLIFDEPTSGLDLIHMKEAAESIRWIRNQGRSVLVITHDLELILRCATYVVRIDKGKIAEQYPLDEAGITRLMDSFEEMYDGKGSLSMEKAKKRSVLTLAFEWAGEQRSLYVASVICAVISVLCKLIPYYFIGLIINNLIAQVKAPAGYVRNIVLIALLFIASELLHQLSTSMSHRATFAVLRNVRKKLLEKLLRMPLGRVLERGTGSIKSTMMERVDATETALAHLLPEFTSNLIAPVVIFIALLTIDVRMAFISLIPSALGIFAMVGLFSGYQESYQATLDASKKLNDTAIEYVSGIEVIKAFGRTDGSYHRFVEAAQNMTDAVMKWMRRCALSQATTLTLLPYTLLSVLPFGAWFVYNGTLTLPDFVMAVILSLGLIAPLVTLGSYTDDVAAMGTIFGEITDILDEEETNHPDVSREQPQDHSVALKNVTFAYKDVDVLKDISLDFAPDTVNAIVGPSGSGKSTIARLIAGFWDVQKGEIDFGGVKSSDLSTEDLRKLVSYVSQDNYLFDETIRENIRQGNPQATDEQVEEIARQSGCYDFIMSLPEGFETVAGSGGGHLSGGERQRISIARAMLKNAPIIILDEATAYTDPENEAMIERSLASLIKGKTLIMIAHRLYTIQNADRIFLIDDGKLAASGTHNELLEKSALYQKMWKSHIASRDTDEEMQAI